MKREEKKELSSLIGEKIKETNNFYITDVSELTVNQTTDLRKLCYDNDVELKVVKNTLIKKAFEIAGINDSELLETIKGPSSIMFSNSINAPAKLIKEFRKTNERPLIKVAYVEENIYVGDDKLEMLANLKSKEELIADVVQLLNSPMKKLISALNGGAKIMGVLETLSKKEEE
ncbi:MAG: 50S ribosomal protein L10 [Bacteroidota bacterium]|nr:50S ribosomal protein L10 [Bacteroidota bacterium]